MAKRKIPSQAASGAETFNDFLVGRQITDGSSALTNTVFAIDKIIPQKDNKTFKTNPFSEFLTLETLKDTNGNIGDPTTSLSSKRKTNEIRFKTNKKYGDKSLFGSLNSRILVSITKIIENFPGGVSIVQNSPIGRSPFNVDNISYNDSSNITTFYVEKSKLFNPFQIQLVEPNSFVKPIVENELRNFYSSFKKYVLEIEKVTYPIIEYTEPNNFNVIELKVFGKPFTGTTYSDNILIRPNDGIVEEFFLGLDDLEESLLNRESSPIYTTSFKVPKDSLDGSKTSLVDVSFTWPIASDNYNIQIIGLDFERYVLNLKDISNEIDNFKSNLTVRFLASPQLFEFDTEDKRTESIFQLYGQSFDKVKKYIDNIAFMRNVSYDKINNIPDILLKNLAENLGLSTINLFDQKNLDDVFYNRIESNYEGTELGTNLIESEYEFYRRLLVNLAYIYKSKGTKSSIDFFLRFLGAPEPLIKIEGYIYKVTSIPSSFDLEKDIYDVIQGNKVFSYAIFNETNSLYEQVSFTATTTYDREGYPVDENTGLPRRAYNETENIFFQKGAGWYDETLDHRSMLILDENNSVLSGRTKTIVTKNKPYSYGEEYFDQFRTLPGLDTGYNLELSIDDKIGNPVEENVILILNRKNIGIYISPSRGVDYDIYRQTRELEISFGTNTLPPQTGKTFIEFLNTFIHTLITNSNVIRYKKNYIQLEDVYRDYISQTTGFTPYHHIDIIEFVDRISPYWVQLLEQLVPSTTLWTGGNLIENNVFGRPKFHYKYDCQPLQFTHELYPDFETIIHKDIINILGEEANFRSLLDLTGITYYPIIEIDGDVYGGPDYEKLTTSMYVTVSGITNTNNSSKLFDPYVFSGCSTGSTNNVVTDLSLICDFKNHISPDIDKIKGLWSNALSELIKSIVTTKNGYTCEENGGETLPCTENLILKVCDFEGCEYIEFSWNQNNNRYEFTSEEGVEAYVFFNETLGRWEGVDLDNPTIQPVIATISDDINSEWLIFVEGINVSTICQLILLNTSITQGEGDPLEFTLPFGFNLNNGGVYEFYNNGVLSLTITFVVDKWELFDVAGQFESPGTLLATSLSDDLYGLWNIETGNDVNIFVNCDSSFVPCGLTTGGTGSNEVQLINFETYVDKNNIDKIKFTSVKLCPNECSVSEYLNYRFETDYDIIKNTNEIDVNVYSDNQIISGGTLIGDIFIEIIGDKTEIQEGSDYPFYVNINCLSGFNQNADIYVEYVGDCTFKLTGISENDIIDVIITDASNKQVKFKIVQFLPEFQTIYNYGLKCDTTVLYVDSGVTINQNTTHQDIENFINSGLIIEKNVCDIIVGDFILSAEMKPCNQFTHQQIVNGQQNGFPFTFTYLKLEVDNIECLTSVKKSIITGQTLTGDFEVFEVLPTTRLRVYTNKIFNGLGSFIKSPYFFDNRLPNELNLRPVNFVEPCCAHNPIDLEKNGDFILNQFGELLEVIDVNLNFCDVGLYYNMNFKLNNSPFITDRIFIFNGNVDHQLLISHNYNIH